MSRKRKVFVIGLDGATFELIKPWVAQGKLPTLEKLMREGASGTLRSVRPPITGPAWASFLTGKNPGAHGVFSWIKRKNNSYDGTPYNSSHIQAEDIGSILSRHSRKVCLVNVPCTYPPKVVNGCMLTGLGTPTQDSRFTYPDSLRQELINKFDYEVERTQKYQSGYEDSFRAVVEAIEEKRAKAVLYLMAQYDWDFFMVVFRGTDVLSHAFWRFIDPTHPAHDPKLASKYGNVLMEHYQQMDQAVQRIWSRLDDSTTIIVMSDHGSGPLKRHVYLDNFLLELGLMKVRRAPASWLRFHLFKWGLTLTNVRSLLVGLRLENLVRRVMPMKKRLELSHHVFSVSSIDWANTKAYPLGANGHIYVNLRGREPEGCVEPGHEYEQVLTLIEGELLKLRDPDGGQRIVSAMWRKEDIYHGGQLANAPDLLIEWKEDAYWAPGTIGRGHGIMSPIMPEMSSGGHTMDGILIAYGPHIKRGTRLANAQIIDLAPTILYLLDVPIPSDMDGHVLEDTFEDAFVQSHSPQLEEVASHWISKEYEDSLEDKKAVEERLRGLGYI
ncbi:MAG: alkaline phosphatase family protein [Anaerolineae bacterium]|nr:alkaline phosphatase family protein [Anaerolineae bacterium]